MDRTVTVWDPFVRVFHWSLVSAFAVAWITADEWDQVHEWSGYVAGTLVAMRIGWGLIGPHYARFSQFVRRPRAVMSYLRDMAARREKRYLGHNPAGGAMVLALLLGVVMLTVTGWLTAQEASLGIGWAEDVHEAIANIVLALVGLHIAGVVIASMRHGENLVRAMFTGRKRQICEASDRNAGEPGGGDGRRFRRCDPD